MLVAQHTPTQLERSLHLRLSLRIETEILVGPSNGLPDRGFDQWLIWEFPLDPSSRAVQCGPNLQVRVRLSVGPCLRAGTGLCEDVIPKEIVHGDRFGFGAARAQSHPGAHHRTGHQQRRHRQCHRQANPMPSGKLP
jgi:hypothetical protein